MHLHLSSPRWATRWIFCRCVLPAWRRPRREGSGCGSTLPPTSESGLAGLLEHEFPLQTGDCPLPGVFSGTILMKHRTPPETAEGTWSSKSRAVLPPLSTETLHCHHRLGRSCYSREVTQEGENSLGVLVVLGSLFSDVFIASKIHRIEMRICMYMGQHVPLDPSSPSSSLELAGRVELLLGGF